jgi:ectoine hydroxylase-related dioxygenase (phytanoyl-CoA dioxygenase family)
VELHQDWAFYPHTNSDLVAMGFFLDDVTTENAPLLVWPGTHADPYVATVTLLRTHSDCSKTCAPSLPLSSPAL